MPLNSRSVAGLFLLCAACSRTPEPAPSLGEPLPPGTIPRFTGEVVLAGKLARATDGSVEISVRPIGGKNAIWSRSYEIGDPWWTESANRRSLPFGLSPLDGVEGSGAPSPSAGSRAGTGSREPAQQAISKEMEIVVRFDADGDPDTAGPDDVELVQRALTGTTDLVLTLGGPPANLRVGPDLSQTSGGLATPVEPHRSR
jgi:hypothetical protein